MDQLYSDVALANRIAHRAGLVTATGHISARVPGTQTFLIPPRASPALATPERLLVMDVDGNRIAGDDEPNSEHWIHARLYAARPDAAAVAHVHAPSCVVLGSIGDTVRALHNLGALFDVVPVFDSIGLVRSRERGDAVAAALGGARAMLLRGHGANVVAADVRIVTVLACYLEEAASRQVAALAATGGAHDRLHFYTPEERLVIQEQLDAEAPLRRAWQYYAALTERDL